MAGPEPRLPKGVGGPGVVNTVIGIADLGRGAEAQGEEVFVQTT